MLFPNDFLWGTASSAHQVEGAYSEDGKVLGIWDALVEGKIANGENGHVASDHYRRYVDDVKILKQIGVKAYRFSVSWPRIISDINGTVNQKGLDFYSKLVDELLKAGIKPLCTLFHWNLPMWAYDEGGLLNDKIFVWFKHYVKVVVSALSDRVSDWCTINEPDNVVDNFPGRPFSDEETSKAIRNILMMHGTAVKTIRENAKTPSKVGIVMGIFPYQPPTEKEEDIKWAYEKTFNEQDKIGCAVWTDPAILGTIPKTLKGYVTEEDILTIRQPLDYFFFNNYSTANHAIQPPKENAFYKPGMPMTHQDRWAVAPDGIYWMVRFVYQRYHLPMMVTENGMANLDWVMSDGKVHDPQRIDFIRKYLTSLYRAIEEGYPVKGYFYWSFLDSFEWTRGYTKRFGLVHVDYTTFKRTLKDSAYFYSKVIKTNGENLDKVTEQDYLG